MKIVQFKLRFREELRVRIEAAARANGTSMNAEIVNMLERSLTEANILNRIDQAVARSMGKVARDLDAASLANTLPKGSRVTCERVKR